MREGMSLFATDEIAQVFGILKLILASLGFRRVLLKKRDFFDITAGRPQAPPGPPQSLPWPPQNAWTPSGLRGPSGSTYWTRPGPSEAAGWAIGIWPGASPGGPGPHLGAWPVWLTRAQLTASPGPGRAQ